MKRIANVLLFFALTLLLTTSITAEAGILESINKEITALVKKAESYIVTVEAEDYHYNEIFVGSGILIDRDGYILTTSSVADSNDKIIVRFKDGDIYPAEIVGIDPESGAALLKIESVERQTPKFGDPGKLQDGAWVTVIGNSYDMPTAVNFGMFSGITDDGLMQLSAQSGPGNTGGAVFNAKGELIGMLVAQTAESVLLTPPYENHLKMNIKDSYPAESFAYMNQGINMQSNSASLALGIDKLNRIVDQLKKFGKVKHGFLGITQTELPKKIMQKNDLDGGVLVTEIISDSPANRAGLLKNDIIVKVENTLIEGTNHLYELIRSYMPGDVIKLEIIRDGSSMTIIATLGEAMVGSYKQYYDNHKMFNKNDDIWLDMTENFEEGLVEFKEYLEELKNQNNFQAGDSIDYLEEKLENVEHHLKGLTEKIAKLYDKLEKSSK
ncbi:MAG: trypsin-like peptidase domain-containing protein [candidate division Zixibacteria bacterium]|nr:trypsin-like peptidase domain-containing protein [candidate division Zixibacteria bacterium]